MNDDIIRAQEERNAFLLKYRTTTVDGHPTFDLDRYYRDMPTEELVALRARTIWSLDQYPHFGTHYYRGLVDYLDEIIGER